ncbi:hypothetical protein JP74_01865 [Devosia sp. 17-2-E-8]|nr:hypothetical protein JP74_01865 [Devosia sp. 17-2-E-8]
MSFRRLAVLVPLVALLMAGCARPPQEAEITAKPRLPAVADSYLPMPEVTPRHMPKGVLAGRKLVVSSAAEIQLQPGEVILSFDDGPRKGSTDSILATLDDFNVKATFLMVGKMADAYPQTARNVAAHGHAIGTHTYDHLNLANADQTVAMDDVYRGEAAVARALKGSGHTLTPFFRFPYLAQTGLLRASLSEQSLIVLDVQVDSQDYLKSAPQQTIDRTLARLDKRGRGIILFHDIHPLTAALLPDFLQALADRGYKVVQLVSRDPSPFGEDLVTASKN